MVFLPANSIMEIIPQELGVSNHLPFVILYKRLLHNCFGGLNETFLLIFVPDPLLLYSFFGYHNIAGCIYYCIILYYCIVLLIHLLNSETSTDIDGWIWTKFSTLARHFCEWNRKFFPLPQPPDLPRPLFLGNTGPSVTAQSGNWGSPAL